MAGAIATPVPQAHDLTRRAAVTVGAVVFALIGARLPLPFVDRMALQEILMYGRSGNSFGLLALSVYPFLSASVLVEMVAMVVPRWRRLRHGTAAGRARLTRAAWTLALVFMAIQAWSITSYMRAIRSLHGTPVLPEGLVPSLGLALSIMAGSLLLTKVAFWVGERGLGNGFAVLVAASVATDLGVSLRAHASSILKDHSVGTLILLLAVAVVLFMVIGMLRSPAAEVGPRVPSPTCGVVSLSAAAELLLMPAALAAWFPSFGPIAKNLQVGTNEYFVTYLLLAVGIAVVLVHLFCSPVMVSAAWERSAPELFDAERAAAVRSALARANRLSVALIAGMALFPALSAVLDTAFYFGGAGLAMLAIIPAVVLDLSAEVRARTRGEKLVIAHAFHRVYAVEPVLEALARANVPAVARTRYFRALFHFFAPYAPIEILVPAERAVEVDAICSRIVGDVDRVTAPEPLQGLTAGMT